MPPLADLHLDVAERGSYVVLAAVVQEHVQLADDAHVRSLALEMSPRDAL